jgi:hypothetical protein
MTFTRITPGYYTSDQFEIIRAVTEYGTDWRLIDSGEWCQSFNTLRDAKAAAENINAS